MFLAKQGALVWRTTPIPGDQNSPKALYTMVFGPKSLYESLDPQGIRVLGQHLIEILQIPKPLVQPN